MPSKSATKVPTGIHLISGAISGSASVILLQPLDLIKTRIQQDVAIPASTLGRPATGTASGPTAASPSIAFTKTPVRPPKSILGTTRGIVSAEGVRGLWRGTIPTLYRNVPGVSLYFLTLAKLRSLLSTSALFTQAPSSSTLLVPASALATAPRQGTAKAKLTTTGDLIVGSTARTGVGFLLMPATLLKTLSESSLAQSSPTQPRASSISLLAGVYRQGGVQALWRGSVPTILRDAPGAGLFIVFYERVKRFSGVERSVGGSGGGGSGGGVVVGGGIAGASASLLSTLLTTPFDLLKTRRQLSPQLYPTLTSSIMRVYTTSGKGILGFWEGASLRVSRKAASAAVGWAVYEGVLEGWETRAAEKRAIRERGD